MRAVTIREFGDPSGMVVVDLPDPTAGAGQVLVRTEAIGVGGVDVLTRRGALGARSTPGTVLGSEVAGYVTAVGVGVDPSWRGRRVWAATGSAGGYAELAVADLADVTPLPDDLPAVDAVTLGSAATVAHFALARAPFAAGESVLVRGAAGSIGIAAVELAVRGGARVVAVTTSSPDRGRRLRDLGATAVLDRTGAGDPDAPSDFDVVIDVVGGADVSRFIDRLAPNGRMVLVGAVGGFPPGDFGMRLMETFQRSRSVATLSLASVPAAARDAVRSANFAAAVRGALHPVVHDVLPLDQAADAHRAVDRGAVFGRIGLRP
jgi:NADPH2:quinone reductase